MSTGLHYAELSSRSWRASGVIEKNGAVSHGNVRGLDEPRLI